MSDTAVESEQNTNGKIHENQSSSTVNGDTNEKSLTNEPMEQQSTDSTKVNNDLSTNGENSKQKADLSTLPTRAYLDGSSNNSGHFQYQALIDAAGLLLQCILLMLL